MTTIEDIDSTARDTSATALAGIAGATEGLRKARDEALVQFIADFEWQDIPVQRVPLAWADTHGTRRAPGGIVHLVEYHSTRDGLRRPGFHAVDECADVWLCPGHQTAKPRVSAGRRMDRLEVTFAGTWTIAFADAEEAIMVPAPEPHLEVAAARGEALGTVVHAR